jgi:hypothetical protein
MAGILLFAAETARAAGPHPRIWIDDAILQRLQAAKDANSPEWQTLKNWCDSNLGANLSCGYNFLGWYRYTLNYGLVFQVTGNQTYGNEGVIYLKAMLRDAYEVGDGQGGANNITRDSGYVARSIGTGVGVGRDWLSGASDLTPAVIDECAQRLDDWITWFAANGFSRDNPLDNYYAGYFAMVYTTAIGLEDDPLYDSAWMTQAESMWSDVLSDINTYLYNGDWTEGWNYGPWVAREYMGYPHALETSGASETHWDETDWAAEVIRGHIHMLYPGRNYFADDGCWSGDNKGDPRQDPVIFLMTVSDVDATTAGLGAWYITHLDWEVSGPGAWEDFLWSDTSIQEVAPTVANMGSLAWSGYGHAVVRSDDWNNQDATFVDIIARTDANEERNVGEVKIGSREEILLVDGQTWQTSGATANVPRITGTHTYAPYQEWWHDAVTFDFENDDYTYAYARIDNIENCYDGVNDDDPSAAYFRRDVAFMVPDCMVVFDNITATSTSNLITGQWHLYGDFSIAGDTATLTGTNAKLFVRTLNPSVNLAKVDSTSTRAGVWRLDVSPTSASVPNKIVTVFEAADSSQGSMTAVDLMQPTSFIGAHFKDSSDPKITLFATAEDASETSCSFTFTPTATVTNVLLVGMQPSTGFSVTVVDNGPAKDVTVSLGGGYVSSVNGALNFDVSTGGVPDLQITTTSLPDGTISVAYSQTLQATGGVTPYSWSIISGSLPAGLSLNSSTGGINGTPTTEETANFTVQCTDSQDPADTDTQALSITINAAPQPLEITTTSLPDGTVGAGYSQTVQATGGVTPYSWAVVSGSLPAGLSLNSSTGEISGTPTTVETANFTVEVTDSDSPPSTDQQALSIDVNAANLVITTTSLPNGAIGSPYSQTLQATGGVTPYTWAVISGSLPAGLSLNSSTGEISGTPTTEETANFTVEVTDSQGTPDTDTQALSITVTAAQNVYYVSTTGNDGWDGSEATPWATLQHAVDTISAGDTILVKPGTYAGAHIDSSGTASQPKTLKAQTAGTVLLNQPGSGAVRSGIIENEYADYWVIDGFEIDCNSGAYRGIDVREAWQVTISNNVVYEAMYTGIFTAFCDYLLVEDNVVYDSGEHGIYTSNSADNFTIRGNVSYNNSVNGIHMNGDVSQGGDGIMSYCLVEKNVCYNNGASGINCDGVEESEFSNNLLYETRSKGFSLYGIDADISSRNNLLTNNTVLTDRTGTVGYYCVFINHNDGGLPAPVGNKLYNNILYNYRPETTRGSICVASSGEVNFESNYNVVMEYFGIDDNAQILNFSQWQARGYDLNSIQAADTALFVDPTGDDFHLKSDSPAKDAGTTRAEVTDDIEGNSRPQGSAYDIGCYEYVGGVQPLNITTTSLPDGDAGVFYSETLQATGGVTPYSWAVISGALPSGLSLNSSTGEISGTPDTGETANFTVEVTDSDAPPSTDQQALSITINVANLVITTSSLPDGVVGTPYSQTLAATGGLTPYSWAVVSGSLPAGLSLNSSTGEISGTPTTEETANFTVEVTDSQGTPDTAQQALSITINAAPDPLEITTTSLSDGEVGVAYSQTLQATGGVTPYSWAVITGSLPAGLSLNSSTGEISGTPTAYGTSNFTVEVTDSQAIPDSDQQALSIYVAPANLVITTASLPDGTVGVAYSEALQATGGVTPYTWAVISGSLPAGLSLNSSTGEISGTPTTEETANFTVEVTDSQGVPDTDTQALSITVQPATPPSDTYKFAADDTESSTTSTTFQTKVTLQWTPDETDTWLIFGFAEYRPEGTNSTTSVRLQVDGVTEGLSVMRPQVTTEWLSFVTVKMLDLDQTQHTLTIEYASGDPAQTSHIRRARIIAVRKADLDFYYDAADTTVSLTNTPTDYATVNFTPPTAGDYLLIWSAESMGQFSERTYIQSILNEAVLDEGQICARADVSYESYASYAVANLTAAAQTVSLRAWKEAAHGHNIRRCRVAVLRLSDGRFADYASAVSDGESTTTSTTFVEKLSKTWSSGSEGDWLILASGRMILSSTSGLVEAQVEYNDTVTLATQTRRPQNPVEWKNMGCAAVQPVAAGGRQADVDYRTTNGSYTAYIKYVHLVMLPLEAGGGPGPLDITTTSLADGQIDMAYSETLQATGGVTPYSWAVVSGSLPAGLSLNSSTGEISGTPTTGGTSNFTVEVTDSDAPPSTDQQALSIYIPDDLVVTTASLADGQIGVAYSQTLAATGGVTPYSWSIVSGSLPAGLSLNSSTGEISGTPTTGGGSGDRQQHAGGH